MMSARERLLAAENGFLVAMTRIADRATLVVDSAPDLERAVLRHSGAKTTALEIAERAAAQGAPNQSSTPYSVARDLALGRLMVRETISATTPSREVPFPEKDIGLER